ncbi:MAG: 23S rRNA (adenine(2503)-C(2))-methyltransferase RlmN [Planctomycetes bacterium]|nr:23S rRNA (adenine(2503)-C(2))-methyltransferase RlmN [Planctomycetota bacterium]
MSTLPSLTDLPLDAFEPLAEELGEKRFAGKNLARWVFERRARDFLAMSDLSKRFRAALAERHVVRRTAIAADRSDPGGTRAFVLRLADGKTIETVLIPEEARRTVCVSTQVGCPVACVFCASGLDGLIRNLTAGEIIEQVMIVQDALPEGERVSNVVVMGIGEPTMNLTALTQALATWNDPRGLGIGARRITISTVGWPARIDRLTALHKEFGLAISLHAPRQELRERLIPNGGQVPLADLLAAAKRWFAQTGRRVTFEYVLIDGQNASLREAAELAALLAGFPCHVNLIPVNPVEGLPYRRPAPDVIEQFKLTLLRAGIDATVRHPRGDGIAAACGQLRLRVEAEQGAGELAPPAPLAPPASRPTTRPA